MATIQAVLRSKPNLQKLYPLAIRITKNRKTSYIFSGQYIDKKYWDDINRKVKKAHPNSTMLNHLILTKLAAANKKILEAETSVEYVSLSRIKKKIKGKDQMDFYRMAELHLDNLNKSEKFRQYQTQKGRLKKLKLFAGVDELPFKDITVLFLSNFEAFLVNKKKCKLRTIVNYMIMIRKIYNLAIAEFFIDRKYYPFGKGKIQIRIPESEKTGLSIHEVKRLENATNLTVPQKHALNTWLISFYFAGVRASDVLQLRWSDFNDGRLLYRMNKNQKLVSLKIPEKAHHILALYKPCAKNRNDLVFHFLKGTDFFNAKELLTRTRIRTLNRCLELIAIKNDIDKKLTIHIARHSFGNISGDKIPIQMLQKLYRHSSITSTIGYQSNFMNQDTDDALDSIVNF